MCLHHRKDLSQKTFLHQRSRLDTCLIYAWNARRIFDKGEDKFNKTDIFFFIGKLDAYASRSRNGSLFTLPLVQNL